MNRLDWIESGGGPLLLAPTTLVNLWSGTRPSSQSPDATDYERACAVRDEIEAIPLGSAQVVILGDEPDRTAIFTEEHDLIILRWRWAESEEELLTELRAAFSKLVFTGSGNFSTKAGEHLLFDSAYAGNEVAQSLKMQLQSDEFLLETAYFNPTSNISALIHRLLPKNS